jgi:SP family galactose:H+ symporter-like MFS transporter
VDATTGTIAAGAVNLLATAVSVPLIERLGRRPLILTGIAGMGLCTCGIVAALLLKPSHPALTVTLGYTAIVFVMGAVAFFEVGLGAIPWSIGGELFPADSKGAAMSFGAVLSWTGATLVGLLFPLMQKALPNGLSFAPFAACLCAAFVFALRYVPETKGKSAAQLLAEINGAEKVAA